MSAYLHLVAGIEELGKRLCEFREEDAGVLVRDRPVFLVNLECVGVGEDDEHFACVLGCHGGFNAMNVRAEFQAAIGICSRSDEARAEEQQRWDDVGAVGTM